MIKGINKNIDEKSYRTICLDSASSLKDFSLDRKLYFKRYVLYEVVEEKFNQSILMGNLVDCMLLTPNLFDNKFYMSACASSPSGLMLEFVEALYRATRDAMGEDKILTKNFEELSKIAYLASGFKIKYEAVIGKFMDSDNQIYYDELVKVRTNNLLVVTIDQVNKAEQIVEELKVNFVTKEILTRINSQRWTVLVQHQVENYLVDNHPFKSMMDLCIIDHQEKIIQIYDLKCVWTVEGFFSDYYLFRRAYIQGYLYWRAAMYMSNDINSEFYEYTVLPPRFIVCDSINYFNPLIYTMSNDDLKDAYEGFEHKGHKYPGVKEIILNLDWNINNNIWGMSRENYINNGIVNIKD